MYFPYFRGKQFELLTIRDTSMLMAGSDITPIIEPVNPKLNGLTAALDAIHNAGGAAIVIINPKVGKLASDAGAITTLLSNGYSAYPRISAGILLTNRMTAADAMTRHLSRLPTST